MTTTIKLPELGENVDSGDLTKILVNVGDAIAKDDPLLELETEKATIEVPSPVSGVVKELHVQQGQRVKVGDALFTIDENGAGAKQTGRPQKDQLKQASQAQESRPQEHPSLAAKPEPTAAAMAQARKLEPEAKPEAHVEAKAEPKPTPKAEPKPEKTEPQNSQTKPPLQTEAPSETEEDISGHGRGETVIPFRPETAEPARRTGHLAPASPAIRRLARELGIDINKIVGTGPEGRIDEEDVKNYAREIISRPQAARSGDETFAPLPDFAKWGQIERKAMTNVRRATAEHLAQAWHNVPQVTQFDRADVTELEDLRSRFSDPQNSSGPKITVTSIALKVVAAALDKFPQFAASIDMTVREIIYKRYCNIGIAVDTSYGLVVPVVRDVDRKSIPQIARELTELSERARDKKLSLDDMAGGVFTITNLGGIGGTGFSPIVNYPEVAILGISRLGIEPRQIDGSFHPRKILPLSLSYDHRLIDGADAVRFLRWVAEALEQPALLLFRA